MNIWFITDTHHGVHRSLSNNNKTNLYKSGDYWLNNINSFYENFYIPLLKKEFNHEEDYLFHLGDVFHVNNDEWLNIKDLDFTVKIFNKLLEIVKNPIYILVGNHDTIQMKSLEINALNGFENDKIKIIKSPEKIKLFNKEILLLPYYRDVIKQKKILKENKADYLFCHSDINGASMNKNRDDRLKSSLLKEDYDNFNKIISGHIHINQYLFSKRWLYLGSPYQMDLNDKGDIKGVWKLNLETDEMTLYENNHNPIFKDIILHVDSDLKNLDIEKYKNNFNNIEIKRSILMSNGKIKDQIQEIIANLQPYNIKWINDVKHKKVDDSLKLDGKLNLINDDMYDVIEKLSEPLIKDKEYKNDIKSEINNIIDIHKNIKN